MVGFRSMDALQLPLVTGSVPEAVDELRRYLARISGANFQTASADRPQQGIFVGLAEDYPQHDFEHVAAPSDEGFLIRSDGRNLMLVAHKPLGVQHAVVAFLRELGCRWFFPGEAWGVVPRRRTITGSWDLRDSPDFPVQRRIWPGFGLYRQKQPDYRRRVDHLRMYLHYLVLRHRLRSAAEAGDNRGILAAIEAETVLGGRLNDTNMIHTRPLIGRAFARRFREFEPLLARLPEENREGRQWRRLGTSPSHQELESLWEEDRIWLRIE